MSNIIIPGDRTIKQPVRAYCTNPECLESSDHERFEFQTEHSPVVCPKCGANEAPMVGLLVLVHYLHRQKDGPIKGVGGLRYQIACDEKRAYLATLTNQEAMSGELRMVNCPGCLKAAQDKGMDRLQGFALIAKKEE